MKAKKLFRILMAGSAVMYFSSSVFGQDCEKYINEKNQEVKTKNLLTNVVKVGSKVVDAVFSTNLASLTSSNAKEIQRLDDLQYLLCEQIQNIKTDYMRDKSTMQHTNMLTKMVELQEPENNGVVADNSKNSNSEQKADVTEKVVIENNPTPTPTPTPTAEYDTEQCEGKEYMSDKNFIRANGYGWSMDKTDAQREARTAALENLAISIEVTVKALAEEYTRSEKINMSQEFRSRRENIIRTSVNQTISGVIPICSKPMRNTKNNNWEYFIVLEVSKEDVLKNIHNKMQQDAEGKNAVSNYDAFKQTFDEVMATYEASEVMGF